MQYRDRFVSALLREIKSKRNYLGNEIINTIYFGGGTPSMLSIDEINLIISSIAKQFSLSNDIEITLEANPDDLDYKYLKELQANTPVNRLSIGVQSFFDDDLAYLNRVHNSFDAQKCIKEAQKAGFINITIDLIYGIPTLSKSKWKKNMEIFFSLDVPHLSAYSLTVENKTALDVLIRKKKMKNIDENQSIVHFSMLMNEIEKHEFIHYEISNFAKKGYYSKHNSIYWLGGHYLGLGPSAHSYNGKSRQWNVSSITKYCNEANELKIINEKEVLTIDQLYNEYILTSIRTSWGCDIEHISNVFGTKYFDHFNKSIAPIIKEEKVHKKGNKYYLTQKGKLFADGISSDLFYLP